MNIKFHFDRGKGDIRPSLQKALSECLSFKLVAGFVTQAGISDLGPKDEIIKKLDLLIFGDANDKALKSMATLYDELQSNGRRNIIKIHLGYGNVNLERDRMKQLYRPMMHSKIFLFLYSDNRFKAYIGSQNITGYSLRGLNSEAIIEVNGLTTDKTFQSILCEIQNIEQESKSFKKEFIDIYRAIHNNYVKGIQPQEVYEKKEYFSVLYAFIYTDDKDKIMLNQTLYFEVPENALGHTKIETYADVWLIPIDKNSDYGVQVKEDLIFFRARQTGANDASVAKANYEKVDWIIQDISNPVIKYMGGKNPDGSGIQVLMKFEKDFANAYPELHFTQIRYTQATRKVVSLTPEFLNHEKIVQRSSLDRSLQKKGEEILNDNAWALIDRFKEMDENISSSALTELPSPNEIQNLYETLKKGLIYEPKVRFDDFVYK